MEDIVFIPEIHDDKGNKYGNFTFYKKGGMGELYKGNEIHSGVEIVLKLILIGEPEDETLLQTEVDVISKFKHKNIASALNVGKLEIGENKYLFYIQKYYKNGSLTKYIEKIYR